MTERPENYDATQLSWSRARSDPIRQGAQKRVSQCMSLVNKHNLTFDQICVIGPQHGFEMQEFARHLITKLPASLMGVDCVQEFVDDCTSLGYHVQKCDAEDLPTVLASRRNFYSSHSLEHCYDLKRAVENIVANTLEWVFVCVPIEPGEVRDKAHFSPIRSIDGFKRLFEPLVPIWEYKRPSESGIRCDFRCLFKREL